MVVRSRARTPTIEEARRLLGTCILFKTLGGPQRQTLLAHVRIVEYANSATIFRLGEPGTSLMAVLDGNVRVSITSPDDKELVLAILEPGDILGEIAVLDGGARTADAIAAGGCTLAILERADLIAFLHEQPSVWIELVKVLCERFRRADELLSEIALLQVPIRLAKTILRNAKQGAQPTGSQLKVGLPQREIANLIGATRESVNKCLSGWQRTRIVDVKDGIITVLDERSLRRLADFGLSSN